MTELELDAAALSAAALDEQSDPGTLEALIYPQDWAITDNSIAANVTDQLANSDGQPVVYSGNNVVTLRYGNDVFDGAGGNDVLRGNRVNDHLFGGDGNDVLAGGAGFDTLSGGRGRDVVRGGGRDDVLMSDGARDWLDGGSGDDWLTGGSGADRFVFRAFGSRIETDVITDFMPGLDRVVITSAMPVFTSDGTDGALVTAGDHVIALTGVFLADLSCDDIVITMI